MIGASGNSPMIAWWLIMLERHFQRTVHVDVAPVEVEGQMELQQRW